MQEFQKRAHLHLHLLKVIGYPAEVYNTGLNILMLNIARVFTTITVCLVYIPLFYRLNIISTYEIFYLGFVTYAPSFALSQVTGIDLWISVVITGLVCTLYTTLVRTYNYYRFLTVRL
ncbi:hypothetical protein chiPu_0014196 [Chiloscyllium punctatum]|uniref:Uncharacterized protein n=1 Tax=Chiloscyllium punctatum TaxID=137246 RepID=A0A401SZ83_CHIPU|nr:hypothetical protein [Chiloscyllium punctatum]